MSKKKKDKKRAKHATPIAAAAGPAAKSAGEIAAGFMARIGKLRLTAALLELAATKFAELGASDIDLCQFFPRGVDRSALMESFYDWDETPGNFDPARDYRTASDVDMMRWIVDEMHERIETLLAGIA